MREFPVRAQIYLMSCYLGGAVALGWMLFSYHGTPTAQDWLLCVGLAVASALCQVFVVARVGTHGQRSDHLTLTPLFAAVLLLPRPLLALVIIITFVPEWYLHRRSWFGQVFNISAYMVAATLARLCLFWFTGHYRLEDNMTLLTSNAVGLMTLLVVFEVAQTFMLAMVLKLVRGQSFRTSGLFTWESLLLEISLLCMGLGFATSWIVAPLYGVLSALPLVLIFQALHVPNLKEQATTDPKTGLANMRHFNEVFARQVERARQSYQPLSLLICDLDYLRNINNTYGHQAGDVVLQGIADTMRHHLGDSHLAARFGGEEFVILLPEVDTTEARQIAERIRSEFEQLRFAVGEHADSVNATVSIGVATYPHDGETTELLLREADMAVYQAKRDGRNQVAVAGYASRGLAGEWAREHLVPASLAQTAGPSDVRQRVQNRVQSITGSTADERPSPTGVNASTPQRASTEKQGNSRNALAPHVLAIIVGIVIAGLLMLWPGLQVAVIPWGPLLLFAALTIVAEQVAVDNTGRGKISVSIVTILSATFLYHELGILATTVAAVVSMVVKSRSLSYRMLFNFGCVLLSAEGAYWVFATAVETPLASTSIARLMLPAIAAGLTYHVINQVLLCLVRGLTEQRRPWEIWYAEYRWLWPHYAVFGALALIVALGYSIFGSIGVVAFMAPVGMMHIAIKQYLDHTKVYISELRQMNQRLNDTYQGTLEVLSRALDTRDDETEAHSQRVSRYSKAIAQQLGLPTEEIGNIEHGALLHDIGKIGVPDAILLKRGKLTSEELAQMRKHPEIGYYMIANVPFLSKAAEIVLHHHEAYDGSGYPSGLAGENIPLGARIFAVADTFDAMTHDRPYRRALPLSEAYAEIRRCRGQQFDPHIVDAFMRIPASELSDEALETPSHSDNSDSVPLEQVALAVA